MFKSQFSETQFFIAYTRELFTDISLPYRILAPSTKEEKKWASDLIIRRYSPFLKYSYSEFYQFKRSKYYKKEAFDDLTTKVTVNTKANPMYGFNIYNSSQTEQFNVLQRLAQNKRNRVYYCAPLFHKTKEFNTHFDNLTVLNNSKVFNIRQPFFQNLTISHDSNHKIIFNRATQYICSSPIEIEGYIASERNKYWDDLEDNSEDYSLDKIIEELFYITKECVIKNNNEFTSVEVNLFEVKELLLKHFNIHWMPIFKAKQNL